jgi:uncharacterized integral membrane protein (TIGR00698 family)
MVNAAVASTNIELASPDSRIGRFRPLLPGIIVAAIVSVIAVLGGAIEERVFGRAIVEPLVLAILVGMVVRLRRGGQAAEEPGIRFVAKEVLEVAVFLLGATMDVPRLFASGPSLALGIVVLVCAALVVGYVTGRAIGLPPKLATLVACGNAICGNSAIAAVAPVIGAEREDVAAAIALTAVLGVIVVLGLPLLIIPLRLSHYQYGVLAGLSVYAVPQVLAAAFAVSALSGQVATVVKLARVLMLGPVVAFFALRASRSDRSSARSAEAVRSPRAKLVPWFVIGFIVLATLRSVGAVPDAGAAATKSVAGWLTVAAMAALGLSVDFSSIKRVGARVVIAAGASLAALMLLALALIRLLAIR